MGKNSKRYCIAYGCLNTGAKNTNMSLYSLPKDPERCRKWLKLIHREDMLHKTTLLSKSYEVCELHFEESAFKRPIRLLKPDAVPSKNLIDPENPKTPRFDQDSSSRLLELPPSDSSVSPELTDANVENSFYTEKPNISTETVETQQTVKAEILKPQQKRKLSENSTDTNFKRTCLGNEESERKYVEMKTFSVTTQTETALGTAQTTLKVENFNLQQKQIFSKHSNLDCKVSPLENESPKIKKEVDEENDRIISSDIDSDVSLRFQRLIDWQNKFNVSAPEYRIFALNLLYTSSHAYRCLKTMLNLPNKKRLIKHCSKVSPDIDKKVFEILSMKLKALPQEAKYCTLCIDEFTLKRWLYYDTKNDEIIGLHNINGKMSSEIASNVYVIMLQGMYHNWDQPIAFAFLGNTNPYFELEEWIDEVISRLFRMGFEVKAIISDQDSHFEKFAKEVKLVTVDDPYFIVDDKKIFYIFDAPHLLKCSRDYLLSNDFYYDGKVISWRYIKDLYEDQKQKNLTLVPKLTDAHVQPNDLQRMRVDYAAHIFSNTLYAALQTYIDFGKISEKAKETAVFIKTMNDLLDVLNSTKIKSMDPLLTAFTMSEHQKITLENAHTLFQILKSVNPYTGIDTTHLNTTFENFRISIQSIKQLFEDLKEEGFKYIFTRRLNLDNMERFFGLIKKQISSRKKIEPTSLQFKRAFSKQFLIYTLKYRSSITRDRDSDIHDVLLKAEDVMNTHIENPNIESQLSLLHVDGENDYRIELPEKYTLIYIASYLTFKCSEKHVCDELLAVLESSPYLHEQLCDQYTTYNQNAALIERLKVPPQELIQYIEILERAFVNSFDMSIKNRPGCTIYELLKNIEPVKLCACFPNEYFLKLFVRLRIWAIIKFNNKCLKDNRKSKKSEKEYFKIKHL